MDKKSKVLLIILVVVSVVSIGITFYKTIIQNDFELVNVPSEDDGGLK